MHRLLAGVLGVLVFLGSGAAVAAEPSPSGDMGWSVLDRFGGDPDGKGILEDASRLTPADLNAFAVRVRPSPALCDELEAVVWRVDGRKADPALEPGRECGAVAWVEGEGEHEVEARLGARVEVAEVVVEDELVVALGDSIASGEGNPERIGRWLDRACHRSSAAGFEVAARRLSKPEEQRSLTFVSLGCSGAEVEVGLLGGYRGIAPRRGQEPYAPQVDRLARIAKARAPSAETGSPVDAVLLSVGANDVRFSEIVGECMAKRDCRERSREEALRERLETLEGDYGRLGAAIERAAPGAPVLITEYFDPTRDEQGRFCTRSVGFITYDEARWAYRELLSPLNRRVAAAAAQNGWRLVDGIAADFERHGYCAKEKERWVRRLEGSLFFQFDPWGTLHPSRDGHGAIAERVAVPLSALLGFQLPAEDEEDDEDLSVLEWGGIGIAVIVLLPLLLPLSVLLAGIVGAAIALVPFLLLLAWRMLRLLRPTWPDDPVPGTPTSPDLNRGLPSLTTRQVVLAVAAVVALLAVLLVLAGLIGRAILWLRFWSSHLPADQAVHEVSGSELVAIGSVAVVIFVGLGLLATGFVWLLDTKGQGVRRTRRGLVVIGLLEALAALWIGDFSFRQAAELFLGLAAAALLLHYLVDQALALRKAHQERRTGKDSRTEPVGEELWEGGKAWACRSLRWLRDRPSRVLWLLWLLLPFLLLGAALWFSLSSGGTGRKPEVLLPYLGAALLFVCPGGMAAPGVRWKNSKVEALLVPRVALAVTGLAMIFILLVRDEAWLAGVAAVAIVLGLLCLAVANASKTHFLPYGLAVLVSIPLFAGAAALLRGLESPELQPVAAVLSNGEAVCGAYIGESDGELWIGHPALDERASEHRPLRGSISPVDAEQVEARALGSLEPVDLIEARAAELRNRLLDERGDRDPDKRTSGCAPPRLEPPVTASWQRDLAERHQPELVISRHDRFWPVPVKTLFSVRDRRAAICRQVASGEDGCLRLRTPGEFPWGGGAGESLEYPAADMSTRDQREQIVEALGTADPARSAAEYFLVNREKDGTGPISIQYWFFYPFNYQPVGDKFDAGGFHEGDFESVGVLLSAPEEEPRYVWMARHNKEGRAFPWEDESLALEGPHPRVYVARGSHASYENCEDQIRPIFFRPLSLSLRLDDYPPCDETHPLRLTPGSTPLIDLSRVGWACWEGIFGHRNSGRGIYERIGTFIVADAPKSPLWQQKFGGVEEKPCLGVGDPGGREGYGEEVVEEETGVPATLRSRAGRLERAIDDCSDWQVPAPGGIYMVVCKEKALDRYVESGLEDPGEDGVRIEEEGAPEAAAPVTLPAVRRDPARIHLDEWRISAAKRTVVSVYVSCPSEEKIIGARFRRVELRPGRELRIRERGPGGAWVLTDSNDRPVREAMPFSTKPAEGYLEEDPRPPGKALSCGG